MSLYEELRRGPVRATVRRRPRRRGTSIYDRLNSSRWNRSSISRTYSLGPRVQPRAMDRDLEFEKERLEAAERARLAALEREIELEEEGNRLDDKEVEELKKTILMVQGQVDHHVKENTAAHRTNMYFCADDEEQLVVRRGQEFKLTFTFQRPWSGKDDNLYLNFTLGRHPNKSKGSKLKIKLEEGNDTSYMEGSKRKWGARIAEQSGNTLSIYVYTSPQAIIGQWEYSILTEFEEDGKKRKVEAVSNNDIIVILNPWCKEDQVYMENEKDLDEYILNEEGTVFSGSYRNINDRPWFYGQFDRDILDTSLHLLRKAYDEDITRKMSDPVSISRALSRIINDCDDDGVLTGNWSGDYEGGTKPLSWRGSVRILREYQKTKKPVKYGQCWVFSHVLTTVARALGFPCRSVTNFSSAHDTNMSMTIDKFVDENGKVIKYKTHDSIWNFHVWNEVWMHRPDLDKLVNAGGIYDGWHAIDATPQETSENIYQCGPSPLEAIRSGDVHIGFDTKFIFAEVNGEVCYWKDTWNDTVLVRKLTNHVGKSISTNKPIDDSFFSWFTRRMDITHEYKHPEGSDKERDSVMKALSGTEVFEFLFPNATGVEIEILDMPIPRLGYDINAQIQVKNTSSEDRVVKTKVVVRPTTYWGEEIGDKEVTSQSYSEEKFDPGESKTYDLLIKADDYLEACDEQLFMSIVAIGTVEGFPDDQNTVYGTEDINVQVEAIKIQGPEDPVQRGQEVQINFKFGNPTNKTLTNCSIEVEGAVEVLDSDFTTHLSMYSKKIDNVEPHGGVAASIKVKPNEKPQATSMRQVEVGFVCDELPDIDGTFTIRLKD